MTELRFAIFSELKEFADEIRNRLSAVPGAEVAVTEGPGHGQLGHFLASAEDAELRLAGEDLAAADEAGGQLDHELDPDTAGGQAVMELEQLEQLDQRRDLLTAIDLR